MPSQRRQWMRSFSITMDSSVVNGTPIWMTTATADGLAVCSPRNSSAKFPAPIRIAMITIRNRGLGMGSSQGRVTSATMANRTAAKNSGGTPQCPITIFDSTFE